MTPELRAQICAEMLRRMMTEEYGKPSGLGLGTHIGGRAVGWVEDVDYLITHQLAMCETRREDKNVRYYLKVAPDDFEAYLLENWSSFVQRLPSPEQGDGSEYPFNAFAMVFLNYCIQQNGSLPSERTSFFPSLHYVKLMKLLARSGFAEEVGGQFRWADAIGPLMRRCFIWNEDDICAVAAEEEAFQASVDQAFKSCPELVKKKLAQAHQVSKSKGNRHFHETVKAYWSGAEWRRPGSDTTWAQNDAWYKATEYFRFCDALQTRF